MWKKILKTFFLLALLVASGFAGFFLAKAQITMQDSLSHVERRYDTALKNVDLDGIKVKSDKKIINILIIGNDYRKERNYGASGLTDTMIIGTMDLKHNTLKLTSLMRDLVVDIPGHGKNKLNAANSFGGVELLYKTIAQNFNIELDGYVEVGFTSFQKIVDKVGGVEVELTESEVEYLNRTNYIRKKQYRNVKPGKQTLNGSQALGYCRIRKAGTTINGLRDDYGRTWRQRTVISAIFDKVKKLPMSDWVDIANSVLDGVTTDLSDKKILEYMTDVISMGTLDVKQLQIPVNPYYRSGRNGEFSCGSCIVMTSGYGAWDPSANADALSQFIFDYDGKKEFEYEGYGTTQED